MNDVYVQLVVIVAVVTPLGVLAAYMERHHRRVLDRIAAQVFGK